MKQQDEQQATEQERRSQLDTIIGHHVMHTLGQPADLHAVQVRRLWENRYRVNVLVGGDVTSVRVAKSYFLVTDAQGNIVTSTPMITKTY